MKRTSYSLLRLTASLSIVVFVLTGCSEQYRHRVLTFFFTGVPPLEESAEAEDEKVVIHQSRQILAQSPEQLYSHPLWANGICDPCHQTSANFSIPGVSSRASSQFKTGGGMPGKLVRPQDMLCLRCHTDKSPLRALGEKLWLHNTTAKGKCLECHSQHQSKYPHVLKKDVSIICYPCHEKGKYLETEIHRQPKPCLDCHNAHMGKNRNLLTAEFIETKVVVKDVPGHPEFRRNPAQAAKNDDIDVPEK